MRKIINISLPAKLDKEVKKAIYIKGRLVSIAI